MKAELLALTAAYTKLRTRVAGGRKRSAAPDEKTRLVDAACARLGVTILELAPMLGIDNARLSPSRVFPAGRKAVLMAKLRELAGMNEATGG